MYGLSLSPSIKWNILNVSSTRLGVIHVIDMNALRYERNCRGDFNRS